MARRRWIQIDGKLVEVSADYQPVSNLAADAGVLWNDRAYQDMGDARFSSRSQHREYMRVNGLTTFDDNREGFKQAEKKRIDLKNGIDPSRKQQIEKAIYQINNSRRT